MNAINIHCIVVSLLYYITSTFLGSLGKHAHHLDKPHITQPCFLSSCRTYLLSIITFNCVPRVIHMRVYFSVLPVIF